MAGFALRHYIDLVERFLAEAFVWEIEMSPIFATSLDENLRVFPDLRDKLAKFIEVKKDSPLQNRYGKHDGPFSGGSPLAGFNHCHLRDDAILIYNLANRKINLIAIVKHSEIEGKRQKQTAARISPYNSQSKRR